jgi:hypothetical protein
MISKNQQASLNIGKLDGQKASKFSSYSTPKILRTSMFAIWGMGLLWIPISINAIQNQRNTIKTIAKDAVPSVLLSLRIVDAMSDMDATVANTLLDDENKESLIQDTANQSLSKSQKEFNSRRNDLAERLTIAAKNITFKGEAEAIQKLNMDFGSYLAYVERAQSVHAKGDKAGAINQYRMASTLLDKTLIPKAYELRDINIKELESQYNDSQFKSGAATLAISCLGLMTIGALVALQLFLLRRMRRTLNPMLFGATLVALIFLMNSAFSLMSSSNQLRVLKEDAYDSLLALRSGRALLYGANSDESRYLLDANSRQQHTDAFSRKTEAVFKQSNNQDFLATTIANIQMNQKDPTIKGHFATTIDNITFPGERTVVVKMMQDYKEYMAIDRQIRSLVASNKIPEALALCLGQSNTVFDRMRDNMNDIIKINEDSFKKVDDKTMDQLSAFEIKAVIALGLIAILVFFGLRPRLREYD